MIINQISLTIKYSKISNFNLHFHQNKDFFGSRFKIVAMQDIPDNIPMVIPNCIYKSNEDHSEIATSSEAVVFNVYKIDNGYEKKWELCKTYLKDTVQMIFDFLNIVSNNGIKYQYMGTIVNLSYDNDKAKSMLKEMKVCKTPLSIKQELFDFSNRYTYVKDKMFFINIETKNLRFFKKGTSDNSPGDLSLSNQTKEVLNITVDINDRYSFNENNNYVSNEKVLYKLIDQMSDIINNNINL